MIYLASPYSHPDAAVREARYREACRAAASLIRAGVVVFAPIVQSHPLVEHGLPTTWEAWEAIDRAILLRCDGLTVLMLDGWRESVGVRAEVAMAMGLRLPVGYMEPGP